MNKELNKFLDEYPANKMYPLIYIINFVINSCGYIWNNFTKIVDYRFDKEYNFLNDDSETESIHNTDSEYGTDDEDTIQDSDQDSDHKNKTNLNSEYGTDDEDTNIDSDSDSDHNNKTNQDSDHNNNNKKYN